MSSVFEDFFDWHFLGTMAFFFVVIRPLFWLILIVIVLAQPFKLVAHICNKR